MQSDHSRIHFPQPAPARAATSSCSLLCLPQGRELHWHSPGPAPETCDHSVPFILSETSSRALGNLDLLGVGSHPNHGCCSGWSVKKQKRASSDLRLLLQRRRCHSNHREQLMLQTACNLLQMLYLTVFIANNVPYVRTKKPPANEAPQFPLTLPYLLSGDQ